MGRCHERRNVRPTKQFALLFESPMHPSLHLKAGGRVLTGKPGQAEIYQISPPLARAASAASLPWLSWKTTP